MAGRDASLRSRAAFHNDADELPFFAQQALPRLERLGLRAKARQAA